MEIRPLIALLLLVSLWLAGCKEKSVNTNNPASESSAENVDDEERAIAAKLQHVNDPISQEIDAFRQEIRQLYNNRRFDDLEKRAATLRAGKETFRNGSWKIFQFYNSLECNDDEPESMWELHERIHQEWIAAYPKSITARVAYADFLVNYAWQARGSGYADTVTKDGWRSMGERLASALKVIEESRDFTEKDPYWWKVSFSIALGQGWPASAYDVLEGGSHAAEPKFWGVDLQRAYSLLPRWHGEPGDWEAYAEKTSQRPDGLGAEIYARIVFHLKGYYDNIFRETKASWPRTKEGLQLMRERYPDSMEFIHQSARLGGMAEDRELAKEMFALIGDNYLPDVWGKPERFARYRKWAETGEW